MDGCIPRSFFIGLFLYSLVYPELAIGQDDPLVLQRRAVQRIDTAVEALRKTGDSSGARDLAQANRELAQSNRLLEARGDWSPLAFGLIKQGSIERLQGNWVAAIELYRRAEEAARRGRNVAYQADALAWSALAEKSKKERERDLGEAMTNAWRAVRFAESSDDNDVLARALDVLGTIQIAQGKLAEAFATINREVPIAMRAKDPIAIYHAYLNRQDVLFKMGLEFGVMSRFERCYQAFDQARDDLEQARTIARNERFPALANNTEALLENVEKSKEKFREFEREQRSIERYRK